MAISRSQLVKELEPGLNALFGMEHARYDNEWSQIFATENSDRASDLYPMDRNANDVGISTNSPVPVAFALRKNGSGSKVVFSNDMLPS